MSGRLDVIEGGLSVAPGSTNKNRLELLVRTLANLRESTHVLLRWLIGFLLRGSANLQIESVLILHFSIPWHFGGSLARVLFRRAAQSSFMMLSPMMIPMAAIIVNPPEADPGINRQALLRRFSD
jgi:hypothetical protein